MNAYTHRFSITDWLDDQIEEGCIEVPKGKKDALAYFLHQNFDFSQIWDQLDALTHQYINS